ncbi:MAG: glycosyltransferase family 2 protein [Opitutales bacterium]
MNSPRIIGLMTVKNEADILLEALEHAQPLHDMLLLLDCGSDDDSAEILESFAGSYENVFFLGRIGPHHAREVRRHIWNIYRDILHHNDWWAVTDTDEFCDPRVRSVVNEASKGLYDHIFSEHVNFYYTDSDHQAWGDIVIENERKRSISDRRRYYRKSTSQRRLFRALPWLKWGSDDSFPEGLAGPYPGRVEYLHYQYRDPDQIEMRLASRRSIENKDVQSENPHWFRKDFKATVADASKLNFAENLAFGTYCSDPEMPETIQSPLLKRLLVCIRNMVRNVFAQHRFEVPKGISQEIIDESRTFWDSVR